VPLSRETIEVFQDAIRRLHGSESTYVESVLVHEEFQGETVWSGIVHVFDLKNHPKAERCYAWAELVDEWSGKQRFHAVLHQEPVDSPTAAVRAAIVHKAREQTE
jgi:hypothetical protein